MQRRATSLSSLRSSTVSTPLNIQPIQSDIGTGHHDYPDGGPGKASALKSDNVTALPTAPFERSRMSDQPFTEQVTGLAAAAAAVIMAAPAVPSDLSGAMPAVEASQVGEFLQCKASPDIFPKLRHETVPKAVEENLPDVGVPPPLPESEPPPLPDAPYPDDIPEAGPPHVPLSSYTAENEKAMGVVQQSGMQSSSGSSIGSVGHQQPATTIQQEQVVEPVVVAVRQETVESAPDSGPAQTKSTANPILSAVMSLPGASLIARITGSSTKAKTDTTPSKPSERIEAGEPIAQSTPVPSREGLGEPEPVSSWSGLHAELAAAAVQEVQFRQEATEQRETAIRAEDGKHDISPYATTMVAVTQNGVDIASSSPDKNRHVEEGISDDPPYAKVDLSKKRKYRQTTDSDPSAMKIEESMTESATEKTAIGESDISIDRTEATSHGESLVDVTSSMSPQHGVLALDRTISSASEASQISAKKVKRKKKGREDDEKIGTIYGDEWPSVTKPSSKTKLKVFFASYKAADRGRELLFLYRNCLDQNSQSCMGIVESHR